MTRRTFDIRVTFDHALDAYHIAYHDVVLETVADVRIWASELVLQLPETPVKRIDIVIHLGGLTVKQAALGAYDEERKRLIAMWANRVYRYSGNPHVRTKILTSQTLAGLPANVFATYEECVAALLADRERAAAPAPQPRPSHRPERG